MAVHVAAGRRMACPMQMFTLLEWLAEPSHSAQRAVRSDSAVQLASIAHHRERLFDMSDMRMVSAPVQMDRGLPPPNELISYWPNSFASSSADSSADYQRAIKVIVDAASSSCGFTVLHEFFAAGIRAADDRDAPLHLLGLHARRDDGNDDAESIHLVSSVITG